MVMAFMAFMALAKGEALKPMVPMHWFASEALKTYSHIISNQGINNNSSNSNDNRYLCYRTGLPIDMHLRDSPVEATERLMGDGDLAEKLLHASATILLDDEVRKLRPKLGEDVGLPHLQLRLEILGRGLPKLSTRVCREGGAPLSTRVCR